MRAFILFALIACVSSVESTFNGLCGCVKTQKINNPSQAFADYRVRTGTDLDTYRDECKTELSLSDETIAQFKQWKFEDDHSASYLHCVFKKMELYDDASSFNLANIGAQVGETHADQIKACADSSKDDDHNQEVFKGFKCFAKNNLKLIRGSIH